MQHPNNFSTISHDPRLVGKETRVGVPSAIPGWGLGEGVWKYPKQDSERRRVDNKVRKKNKCSSCDFCDLGEFLILVINRALL